MATTSTHELLDEIFAGSGDDPGTQQEIDLAVNLQLIAQLELSLYANARILAEEGDMQMIVQLLERTMFEERAAEAIWRDIAVDAINPETFSSMRRASATMLDHLAADQSGDAGSTDDGANLVARLSPDLRPDAVPRAAACGRGRPHQYTLSG